MRWWRLCEVCCEGHHSGRGRAGWRGGCGPGAERWVDRPHSQPLFLCQGEGKTYGRRPARGHAMGLMVMLQPEFGRALVVGGGKVALRKVKGLAEAGFEVTVIAPMVMDEIRLAPSVSVVQRPFEPADIDAERYAIVFACTDDREVNASIGRAARAKGLPVLVADAQEESTFFTPAVLRDGDLVVGVSTGGASPTLARKIREQIATSIGVGWQRSLWMARQEREARLGRGAPKQGTEDSE